MLPKGIVLVLGLLGLASAGLQLSAGNPPLDLHISVGVDPVTMLALQPDGELLVGGSFIAIAGQEHRHIARLASDGTPDSTFQASTDGHVIALALQADGRILVGGDFITTINDTPSSNLGRLNPDGSRDPDFSPVVDGGVYALAVQEDGRILVGGGFANLAGRPHAYLGRLNPDGALDEGFTATADGPVAGLCLQPDGHILAWGLFNELGGHPQPRLARLQPDGSVDTAFAPEVGPLEGWVVQALALQPDGRILVGGSFQTLGGEPHQNVGRLFADGSVDTAFTPSTETGVPGVGALAVQADGRILVGGGFFELCGEERHGLGRLHPDGSLDEGYDPGTDPMVTALLIQPDGKVIVATDLFGLYRLQSTDPVENGLARDGDALVWSRGNSGPAVTGAKFEYSDDGEHWTLLGEGTANGTGWGLDGAVVPEGQTVRVRGNAQATQSSAAGWMPMEAFIGPPLFLEQPVAATKADFGNEVVLRARVVGSGPMSYQWQKDGEPLVDGDGIAGAGSATLVLTEVAGASSGAYTLVAVNDLGGAESQAAELQVQDPAFAVQPEDASAMPGEQAVFAATVNGSPPLGFRWYLNGSPLEDGVNFSGTTTPTLTVTVVSPDQVGDYTLQASNSFSTVLSEPARLTVTDPLITSQPADVAANAGETVVLQVAATAASPVTYQWYRGGEPVADGGRISGATKATLTFDPVLGPDAGSYILEVTSPFGVVTTDAIQVSVADPAILTQPADQFAEAGETVSLSVVAAGSEPLMFQWEKNGVPLVEAGRIGGVASDTLTLGELTKLDAGGYRVVVSNSRGQIASREAMLGVGNIDVDPMFSQFTGSYVLTVLSLPDGGVLAGGIFTSIGGHDRLRLVRYHPSGAIDEDFTLGTDRPVFCLTLQPDGKVLLGGAFTTVGGEPRQGLARLNADLTPDTEFRVDANGWVNTLVVQPDGGLLVGGGFDELGGLPRSNLGRLDSTGAVDETFLPNPNGEVNSLALEPGGTLLVGGKFTNIGGLILNYLARLESDGTAAGDFGPALDGAVRSLVRQPDGKIVLGGEFASLGGIERPILARLTPEGVLDPSFDAQLLRGAVNSIIVQTDGRYVIGGEFLNVGTSSQDYLARLNHDGLLDGTFSLNTQHPVFGLANEPDGNLLVAQLSWLGRLLNNQGASHVLSEDGADLVWTRGGASAVIEAAVLERSLDGVNWNFVTEGVEESGQWRFADADLDQQGTFRARGRLTAGRYNGSQGWTTDYHGDPIIFEHPRGGDFQAEDELVLQVFASGSKPLTYQWRRNGVPLEDGAGISGAGTSRLQIESLLGANAGEYDVVVSNARMARTSLPAAVQVVDPWLSGTSASIRVQRGEPVAIEVVSHGTGPFTYQWWKDGAPMEGATDATLQIPGAGEADIGSYHVVAGNAFGEATSSMVQLDVNLARLLPGFQPGVGGSVDAVVPQPDGGVLVGGHFSGLGGLLRWNCGRYLPDGTVDTGFDPQVTGTGSPASWAWSLAFVIQPDGHTILGGQYEEVGGESQDNLGRLRVDGSLETGVFEALPNAAVRSTLLLADGSLIIAGDFDYVGEDRRSCLARYLPDGTLDPDFTPAADVRVFALAADSQGRIVVGGEFTTLAGAERSRLGRLNPDGTLDPDFDPGADSTVYSLAVQPDGRILVGGAFGELGGEPRGRMGRLFADGSVEPDFDARADGDVLVLSLLRDGKILLGGSFRNLGDQPRSRLARLLSDGSLDRSFSPDANRPVHALAVLADGQVIAGGEFSFLMGQTRNGVGRLSATHPASSTLVFEPSRLVWLREGSGPEVWRVVFEHSLDRENWILLGDGVRIPDGWEWQGDSVPTENEGWVRVRGYTIAGQVGTSSWYVQETSGAPELLLSPTSQEVDFGAALILEVRAEGSQPLSYQWFRNGEPLSDAEHLSGSQGSLLELRDANGLSAGVYSVTVSNPWGTVSSPEVTISVVDPKILQEPQDQMVEAGETLILGVEAVTGVPPLSYQWWKDGEALVDDGRVTGAGTALLTLNNVSKADTAIYRVTVSNALGSTVGREVNVAVGQVEGDPRLSKEAIGDVNAVLRLPNGSVLAGGSFTMISSRSRHHLAKFHADGPVDEDFTLGTDGPVFCLTLQPDGKVLVGGAFSRVDGEPRQNLARLNANLTLDPGFQVAVNGSVNTLILQRDGGLPVGGAFDQLGGVPRQNLGRLAPDGSVDLGFDPSPDGEVNTVIVEPAGTLLVGGDFANVGGEPVPRLARLDSDGTVAAGFVPSPNGRVRALALQPDGRILVGGSFNTLGESPRFKLARLAADGTVDPAFEARISDTVHSIIIQEDGRILIGGTFIRVDTLLQRFVVRLNADGSPDASFRMNTLLPVFGLASEPNGDLLLAGQGRLLRLLNNQVATHSLREDGADLVWSRGGASAVVNSAVLERSLDGTTWDFVAEGQRESGGWRFADAEVDREGTLRARGELQGGQNNGSQGWAFDLIGGVCWIVQPQSRTLQAGEDLDLAVVAAGSPPLSYQWRWKGAPLEDGDGVSGAHTANLRVASVLGANAGEYDVVVTNPRGSKTSAKATITVLDPWISGVPPGGYAELGEEVVITATAHGTGPFTYQWWKDGAPLAGGTEATLHLSKARPDDAGAYHLQVSSPLGEGSSGTLYLSVNLTTVLPGFEAGASGPVYSLAPLTDGSVLVGGRFDTLGGLARLNCGRYAPDGTVDDSFDPQMTGIGGTTQAWALTFVPRPDGRVIAGGHYEWVGGEDARHLSRLLPDGSLEADVFADQPNSAVRSTLLLPDGSLLIGGDFDHVGESRRLTLARILPDGTADPDFVLDANARVFALAPDGEGRIVVGGEFTQLGGVGRLRLARILADGSLDPDFDPEANNAVETLVVQPDGRILVGGAFTTLAGQARSRLGRLLPDGTVDPDFRADANASVYAVSLLTDGGILVGGDFDFLRGSRRGLARLYPDGQPDNRFVADTDGGVLALAVRADGQVLVGGGFGTLHGQPRRGVGRLSAAQPAVSDLVFEPSRLLWLRAGGGPEVWRVVFEHSSDRENWSGLGDGIRIPGGWEWQGESVPTADDGWVRVRGYTVAGQIGTSSWYVQEISGAPVLQTWPGAHTNDPGTDLTLEVTAEGGPPLSYQWFRNGEPLSDDDHVFGCRTSLLHLTDVNGLHTGAYTVTVSNRWGEVSSPEAIVTVNDPRILTQPDDQIAEIGETVTLSVEATATVSPLSYQWWKDGEPLPDAQDATLELVDVQVSDAGRYWVVVSSPVGAISSSIAGVEINGALPDPDFQFCLTDGQDSGYPYAVAMEPDGAILVAGHFDSVAGTPRTNVVRFLPDNTVDPSFAPALGNPSLPVNMLAVQPDRRILVGERFHVARYFPDGAMDGSFAIDAERIVEGFGLQPDGRMVLSTYWPRDVVRWLPDGSVEPGFAPECGGTIWTLVLQPDGKIVVGGGFGTLAGSPRDNVGRLNPDGTLDESFNPDVGNYPGNNVHTVALQPDGKILVGGMFGRVGGTSIGNLVRLLPDGSLDSEFKPQASQSPWSLLLQANGKILVGGVTQIDGRDRNGLARLLPDGRVDLGFNPPSGYSNCLGIQKDGAILTWGTATTPEGEACPQISRLLNPDAATESLEYAGTMLTWMRGGGGPEVWRTTFEYSASGTEWTPLGPGTRIAGGWQLATSPRPESGVVRARGYAVGGDGNASTWFVETLLPLDEPAPPQIVLGDGSPRFTDEGFGFDVVGTPGATVIVEVSLDLLEWTELETITLGDEPTLITDPDAGLSGERFYRLRQVP